MLMPLPTVNKFCDMENARRVLGEPTLAEGWNLTDKGTYLVCSDAGFVKVQQWEVNGIYSMLDVMCADQRLIMKLNCKVREYLTLIDATCETTHAKEIAEFKILKALTYLYHSGVTLSDLLGAAMKDVDQKLESVYASRRG